MSFPCQGKYCYWLLILNNIMNDSSPKIHIAPVSHRNIMILFFIGFITISMFDVVYELLVSLTQTLFELFEYSFEHLIEYIFHTNHHQSEIIMINMSFFLALLGLYGLWRGLFRLKRNLAIIWWKQKKSIVYYWRTLTTMQKIKQVSIYTFGFISTLFLLFL
jgi:hypothetical protein